MTTVSPIRTSAWPTFPVGAVPEELDGAERLLVELERPFGAVDDQIGRDAVVSLGNFLHRHRGLLPLQDRGHGQSPSRIPCSGYTRCPRQDWRGFRHDTRQT